MFALGRVSPRCRFRARGHLVASGHRSTPREHPSVLAGRSRLARGWPKRRKGAHEETSARHAPTRTNFVGARAGPGLPRPGRRVARSFEGVDRGRVSRVGEILEGYGPQMGNLVDKTSIGYREAPHPQAVPPRTLPRDARAIRRILVCIDRSPLSEACLQHAVAVSKSLGSAITLLHVMQPPYER